MTLTIADIRTTVFRLPLRSPLKWGKHSVMTEAQHVLVEVVLSDGAVGTAEGLPRPTIYGETHHSITNIIEHELKPRVIGERAVPDHIYPLLQQVKNNQTAKGAVDVALYHALAQSAGQSLADYLGCTRDKVRVSYILGIADDDEMLTDARWVVDQGVRVLKVKVGRNWSDDIRRLRLLQGELDDTVELYTDANETMTADNAASRLAQLSEMGILYCEEPLPVSLMAERQMLYSGQHLPIIGDDSCFTVRDVKRELAANTFDILNIKTARTGYTASKKMLAMAAEKGKHVMIGSHAASALGASRSGIFAAMAAVDRPSELSFFLKMKEDIVTKQPRIADGYISLDELLAVRVDPALLACAADFD